MGDRAECLATKDVAAEAARTTGGGALELKGPAIAAPSYESSRTRSTASAGAGWATDLLVAQDAGVQAGRASWSA